MWIARWPGAPPILPSPAGGLAPYRKRPSTRYRCWAYRCHASLDGGAQWANLGFYAERGAARLLHSWDQFEAELNALLDPSTRAHIRDRLKGLSPAGAAERLARIVLEAA
ncbi:MAG: hypothetical protein KatS3mg071_0332 [Meiothermus sp.]|nr:MAG: hypothetical protein KatS3mg071_0332 [Meiothermus sp.]